MSTKTLKDVYEREIRELYRAETHSAQLFSVVEKGAHAPELSATLAKAALQARAHAARVSQMLPGNDEGDAAPCQSVTRFFSNCMELSREETPSELRDAALIAACQHFIHDLIAGYGCAREWAVLLGDSDAHAAFQTFLNDEKVLDAGLCRIADTVNRRAAQPLVVRNRRPAYAQR